jgi:hypothetical protein
MCYTETVYANSSCTSTDLVLPSHALGRVTVLQVAKLEVAGTGTATAVTVLANDTPGTGRSNMYDNQQIRTIVSTTTRLFSK